jgi:hypothetical protein
VHELGKISDHKEYHLDLTTSRCAGSWRYSILLQNLQDVLELGRSPDGEDSNDEVGHFFVAVSCGM